MIILKEIEHHGICMHRTHTIIYVRGWFGVVKFSIVQLNVPACIDKNDVIHHLFKSPQTPYMLMSSYLSIQVIIFKCFICFYSYVLILIVHNNTSQEAATNLALRYVIFFFSFAFIAFKWLTLTLLPMIVS